MKLGLIILAIVFWFVVVFLKPTEDEVRKKNERSQQVKEPARRAQTDKDSPLRLPAVVIQESQEKTIEEEISLVRDRLAQMLVDMRGADGVVQRSDLYAEFDMARRDAIVQLSNKVLEKADKAPRGLNANLLRQFVKGCADITMTGAISEMFMFDQVELEQALVTCREQLKRTPDLVLLETEREIKSVLEDVLKNMAQNSVLRTSITQAAREISHLGDEMEMNTFSAWVHRQRDRITGK